MSCEIRQLGNTEVILRSPLAASGSSTFSQRFFFCFFALAFTVQTDVGRPLVFFSFSLRQGSCRTLKECGVSAALLTYNAERTQA